MPNLDSLGIELVDRNLGMLSVPRGLRSIRFKNLSFKNISRAWKNFRLARIEKKVNKMERVKDSITNSINSGDIISASAPSKVEKTPAITRLEERVNILDNTGLSNFVGNRAIKLKDNMNRNARYNSQSAYSNLEEKKDFFPANADYLLNENGLYVPNKEVEEVSTPENIRDNIIVVPDRSDVQKAVEEAFSKQENGVREVSAEEVAETVEKENEEVINKEEVSKAVNDSLEEEVNREKIKQAVEEAINKRVSTNASRAAKIEYFSKPANENINEDGSYRLTKDQIDEDFRKTYINENRENLVPEEIEEENDVEFKVEENLNEGGKKDMEEFVPFADENKKTEESVHLDYEVEDIKKLTEASDKGSYKDEIAILMERVKTLKEKQNESKERAIRAAEQAKASEDAKDAARDRLQAYADALEEDLGYNNKSAEEDMKKAENNEKLVEDMLSMIQPQTAPDSVKLR